MILLVLISHFLVTWWYYSWYLKTTPVDSFFFELLKVLILCCRNDSVAVAVENPQFFNRIAETFCSKAAMRFVILLWGKKSSVAPDIIEEIPVFSYNEIIDLGQESRKALSDSNYAGKLILFNINYFRIFDFSIRHFCSIF